jgi:hypothetical protein
MGSLIQTKGTQKLAQLFNARFNASGTGLAFAQTVTNSTNLTLPNAFSNPSNDLLAISDAFIAQNAGATWPADGNDVLYPSATLALNANAAAGSSTLQFAHAAIPAALAVNSAVSSLTSRLSIPHGTMVNNAVLAAGVITVTLSQNLTAALNAGEKLCFTTGKNEQLVRRWRWYLAHDLKAENHAAIQRAISNALAPSSNCTQIAFQAIEDTQRVLINVQPLLDGAASEFADTYKIDIILMTQQTSAPDPLDQQ